MDKLEGEPGNELVMQDCRSSCEGGFPSLSRDCHRMNTALNAFSFEQDPQAIVWTSFSPGGATESNALRNLSTKSLGGKDPNAGRFTNVDALSGFFKTLSRKG